MSGALARGAGRGGPSTIRVGILDWEGRFNSNASVPHPRAADPFPQAQRISGAAPESDYRSQLTDCVEAVMERTALAPSTAVVSAAQAPGTSCPNNSTEYGTSPGRLHPALGGRSEIIVSHACASGGLAIAVGAALVASGAVEQALVLAAMEPRFIERAAFSSSGALSPQPICRPFDAAADGTALGGFTGAMILGPATAGVPMIAGIGIETLGAGAQSNRQSQAACMRAALSGSRERLRFVAAHATGTEHGDRVELDAISDLAIELETEIPVTSCKGALGHSVHAAGLATTMFALESMSASLVPGTAHCTDPLTGDGVWVLDAHSSLAGPARAALVNAFGFGGSSCSLLVVAADS